MLVHQRETQGVDRDPGPVAVSTAIRASDIENSERLAASGWRQGQGQHT